MDITFNKTIVSQARENSLSITYEQYRDQVEEYIDSEALSLYAGKENWNLIQNLVVEKITDLL